MDGHDGMQRTNTTAIATAPWVTLAGVVAVCLFWLACDGQPRASQAEARHLAQCRRILQTKMEAANTKWGLNQRWRGELDQASGVLNLTGEAGGQLACVVQVVGTFSTVSSNWTWAWADALITDPLKNDAVAARDYGRQYGWRRLTMEEWPASERDAWDMTALAAYWAGAENAYCLPRDRDLVFLLIKSVQRREKEAEATPALGR